MAANCLVDSHTTHDELYDIIYSFGNEYNGLVTNKLFSNWNNKNFIDG